MIDNYFENLTHEILKYNTNIKNINFEKINIFFDSLDNKKDKLIHIKKENINHLLGLHYFKQFTNNKNMRSFENVIDYFKYHKFNLSIIKKQFEKTTNKPKIKFDDLLMRFFSYFKIINLFYEMIENKNLFEISLYKKENKKRSIMYYDN